MISKFLYLVCIGFVACCKSVHSQDKSELDSTFNNNFCVLDSLVDGKKNYRQLTNEQKSFMYLLNDWIESNAIFNHYEGVRLTKDDLAFWKNWYETYHDKINSEDFKKALTTYTNFMSTGLADNKDLDFLSEVAKKYRALKK